MRFRALAISVAGALALASCGGNNQATASAPPAAPVVAPAPAEDVTAVLTALERDWVKAILAKDTATVDRILADDFVGSTDAVEYKKSEAIEDVQTGTHERLELNNIRVHSYGTAAVVTMEQNEKSRHGKQDFSGQYLFTDFWVKQNGQWRAVASHGSRVR